MKTTIGMATEKKPKTRGDSFAVRVAESRLSRVDDTVASTTRIPMLRLTRVQRDLLGQGLEELRRGFANPDLWERAAGQAALAERELGIVHFAADFAMWVSNMAALADGAWWLLQPGCGAPDLQEGICRSLTTPFLDRHPEYARLTAAMMAGGFPLIHWVLTETERIRCVLTMHIRER